MQDQIFEMLIKDDTITWQTMIYDLVKTEQMDPWDVDLSILAQRFIQMLSKMKEMDLRISGKVILAAAILLRIKSNKLVDEDMTALDRLFSGADEPEELFDDEMMGDEMALLAKARSKEYQLVPRTPQPRSRKVSVYELVDALEKALDVQKRRMSREKPSQGPEVKIPEKPTDITVIIREVFTQIKTHYSQKSAKLTFSSLVPSDSKTDKIYTFIPLLHLTNQRKIDLSQIEHFGEIEIMLLKKAIEETKPIAS